MFPLAVPAPSPAGLAAATRPPPDGALRAGNGSGCVQRTKDVPGSQGNHMGAAVGILVLLILPQSQDSHAVPHGHISLA